VQSAPTQLSLFADVEGADDMSAFSVRESGRAKRLSIKVYPRGRVEVVVPRRTRAAEVQAFVSENRDWIHRTRASFAKSHPTELFALPNRIELPGIGRSTRVQYRSRSGARTVGYRQHGDMLVLSGRTNDDQLCVAALKRWLASVAKKALEPRLRALATQTGNPFKKMQVRGQRTCWGSHSSTGTISVNYCLLFLEPSLLRYLMIHELCHARHMNHSRRFWQFVGRFEAEYRHLDRQLAESWQQIPTWLGIH
jgi:predicted metal-dependent hydrolase